MVTQIEKRLQGIANRFQSTYLIEIYLFGHWPANGEFSPAFISLWEQNNLCFCNGNEMYSPIRGGTRHKIHYLQFYKCAKLSTIDGVTLGERHITYDTKILTGQPAGVIQTLRNVFSFQFHQPLHLRLLQPTVPNGFHEVVDSLQKRTQTKK